MSRKLKVIILFLVLIISCAGCGTRSEKDPIEGDWIWKTINIDGKSRDRRDGEISPPRFSSDGKTYSLTINPLKDPYTGDIRKESDGQYSFAYANNQKTAKLTLNGDELVLELGSNTVTFERDDN